MSDDASPASPFRILVADDAETLDRVRRLLRWYAEEFDEAHGENLRHQGFAAEIVGLPGRYSGPSGSLLLGMVDDRPAGCVALRDLGEGVCEMKRLYVAPPFRRHGLGRALLEAALRHAEAFGHRRMVLDTIPEMAVALGMYRALGFTETAPYWESPDPRTIYLMKDLETPRR